MHKNSFIVDTNVIACANGYATHTNELAAKKCEDFLSLILNNVLISIDNHNIIFSEYFRYANRSGQPRIGDIFASQLFYYQSDPKHCEVVNITKVNSDYFFLEIENIPELVIIDNSDKVFVSVYLNSVHSPTIYNACDSDWNEKKHILEKYNIRVHELL